MGDLEDYITRRRERDAEYSRGYEAGYEKFKAGLIVKILRMERGLTQEEFAGKLGVGMSAVSRMENHPENLRLGTLFKIAELCGKHLRITIE